MLLRIKKEAKKSVASGQFHALGQRLTAESKKFNLKKVERKETLSSKGGFISTMAIVEITNDNDQLSLVINKGSFVGFLAVVDGKSAPVFYVDSAHASTARTSVYEVSVESDRSLCDLLEDGILYSAAISDIEALLKAVANGATTKSATKKRLSEYRLLQTITEKEEAEYEKRVDEIVITVNDKTKGKAKK